MRGKELCRFPYTEERAGYDKDFTAAQCVDGRNVPADQCFLDCTVHAADLSADEADHREEYDFDFDGKDSRLREQGNFESVLPPR